MKLVSKHSVVAVACTLAVAGLTGCGKFGELMAAYADGDPISNWDVRAVRVPEGGGNACVASCKQNEMTCEQHLHEIGQDDPTSVADNCYEGIYQCYVGCPGANEYAHQYVDVKESQASDAACAEGVPPGSRQHCVTRYGIKGQIIN
jgi:hypothetical protein